MYAFEWEPRTGGYRLTPQPDSHVAAEVRPVYAEELTLLGFDERMDYDHDAAQPLMWCRKNAYFYRGEKVAEVSDFRFGAMPTRKVLFDGRLQVVPVDLEAMIEDNRLIMGQLVADTFRRIREMYAQYHQRQDVVYIAFSGGKDSVLLLDLCHQVLPLNCPVVFSDTTMELPDTYHIWDLVQQRYPERPFLKFSNERPALENWRLFGPPSRSLDWCCSVHKSAPAIVSLKDHLGLNRLRAMAFTGIRGEESLSRNEYDDVAQGVKNASQLNVMPILDWGAHELFLYAFEHRLPVHKAYRYGLPRVGCMVCPKASEKFLWHKFHIYPETLRPYLQTMLEATTRCFNSAEEEIDFLSSRAMIARCNGLELKNNFTCLDESAQEQSVTYRQVHVPRSMFRSWLTTLGNVTEVDEQHVLVTHASGSEMHLTLTGTEDLTEIQASFSICTTKQQKHLQQMLKKIIQKSIACVGCRACEAECSFGALRIRHDGISVKAERCVHCLKCHDIDYGCWRYKSMVTPRSLNTPLKSIASYQTFGIRQDWLNFYIECKGENLPLGKNMIASLRLWFTQSYLMETGRNQGKLTKLMQLADKLGVHDRQLWTLIYFALANNSPLIKWLVTSFPFDTTIPREEIIAQIDESVFSGKSKSRITTPLGQCLKETPIGNSPDGFFFFEVSKKEMVSLTRKRCSITPIAVLYSLYMMCELGERTSFTLSEMMQGDFEAPYLSPLYVFGMEIDELKQQCLGLSSRYPDFISCSFTLGLDEVRLQPAAKSKEDVLDLLLAENE